MTKPDREATTRRCAYSPRATDATSSPNSSNLDKTTIMKTKKTLRILVPTVVALATLVVISCEKENLSRAKVADVSFSECLLHLMEKGYEHPDTILTHYSDGTLFVEHRNLAVNCGFKRVTVKTSTSNDTLTITEHGSPSPEDCICEINNSFQIRNIPQGRYVLVFKNCYPEPIVETVNMN